MHSVDSEHPPAEDRRAFFGRMFTWLGVSALGMSLASTVYANFRFFFPMCSTSLRRSSRPAILLIINSHQSAIVGSRNTKCGCSRRAPVRCVLC